MSDITNNSFGSDGQNPLKYHLIYTNKLAGPGLLYESIELLTDEANFIE